MGPPGFCQAIECLTNFLANHHSAQIALSSLTPSRFMFYHCKPAIRNYFLIALLLIVSNISFSQDHTKLWSEKDKSALIAGLESSEAELLNELKGLNQSSLHFKTDSTQWSIAQVIEHLGIYDELLYWDLLNNQYTPEMPELVEKVKGIDSFMISYTNDPAKLKAPFTAEPLGRFYKSQDLIAYFTRFRNEVISLVKETKADFRLHFIFRGENTGIWHIRDLHQYTLLWIAHTLKHINQIKNIKADINFPAIK